MGNPSPRHAAEFKQKAVEPCRKSGTAYAEVARGLGCDAGSLSDWVKKADAADCGAGDNPFQTAEDLRRLKRENERLKKKGGVPIVLSIDLLANFARWGQRCRGPRKGPALFLFQSAR